MKTSTIKITLFGFMFIWVLFFSGLTGHTEPNGVNQKIKDANAPFNDESVVDTVPPLPDNTVLVKEKYQGGLFWAETRKDKITRFKCSQCHQNKDVKVTQAAEIAHGDILLVHGGKKKPLDCFTCHKKDERDLLVTEKGVNVDMDHSYRMCGHCHFRQKKDWVGGAHGKRVSHWAGKRVVKNCASCHDPHSPRFEKQWPKTYSPPLSK